VGAGRRAVSECHSTLLHVFMANSITGPRRRRRRRPSPRRRKPSSPASRVSQPHLTDHLHPNRTAPNETPQAPPQQTPPQKGRAEPPSPSLAPPMTHRANHVGQQLYLKAVHISRLPATTSTTTTSTPAAEWLTSLHHQGRRHPRYPRAGRQSGTTSTKSGST
jgi:hypothetical protein